MIDLAVVQEYAALDGLLVRTETHRRHSEAPDDLDDLLLQEVGDGRRVLDAGCGGSAFLRRLVARAPHAEVYACDLSPAAVVAARATVGDRAREADIRRLPYGDGFFDRVLARHMIYHVPEPHLAITEMARITSPGGRVVVSVNAAGSLPRLSEAVREALDVASVPWRSSARYCSEQQLLKLMSGTLDDVRAVRRDNALVFEDPEPAVRYAIASLGVYGVARDDAAWPVVAATVDTVVRRRFDSEGAPWRDPKAFVVCTGAGR